MTKWIPALLSAAVLLSLTACGSAAETTSAAASSSEPAPPACENAKVDGNIISSAPFNLRIALPTGWEVLPDEQLSNILSAASQFAQEDTRLSTENFGDDLTHLAVMAVNPESADTLLLVFQNMGQQVDPLDYCTNVLLPAGQSYWEDVAGPEELTIAGNTMAKVSFSYTMPGQELKLRQTIYLEAAGEQLLTITASTAHLEGEDEAAALVENAQAYSK